MKHFIYLILASLVLINVSQAELVLVVHKNFPKDSISKGDLKKIYVNKKKRWSHGGSIVRSVLKKGKTHKTFCKMIKKSPSKLKRFWK
ncbi:substrate-binding domain-containing protein [bacterium]|nr:substrate-binding domain-containing protein [bacterium]